MPVTNENLARWSATLSTVCAYTDDEKTRDILLRVCGDMDSILNEPLMQFKPIEYKLRVDVPVEEPAEIPAVAGVPEPVAPTVENSVAVQTLTGNVDESSLTVSRKLTWSDDEWSILRCASNQAQAREYYHLSEYNGNHTDKAVEQAFYRARSNRELIRVNDTVQVDIKGNAYQGKVARVTKICDDKMHAIIELKDNKMQMQVKITGLRVISHE